MKHFKHMKRIKAFILALCLFISNCHYSVAASKYTLPDLLSVVPAHSSGLSFPGQLPPFVAVLACTMENGLVHLELSDAVPKLVILEVNPNNNTESTIFSKKNVSTADAHLIGKEDPQIIVRMIWPFGETDYVREYKSVFGNVVFSNCSVVEEPQPTDFAPYTLSERTLTFNQMGIPISETRQLSNEKRRLIRTVKYDHGGNLQTVNLTWESVKPGEYQLVVDLDQEGCVTGLFYKEKRTRFYVKSMLIDENSNSDTAAYLSRDSLNYAVFDEKVNKKYPQLALGLIGDVSLPDPEPATMTDLQPATMTDLEPATMTDLQPATMTDLEPATMTDLEAATMTDLQAAEEAPEEQYKPIPINSRIWSVNLGTKKKNEVYVFITTEPILVMKDGKVILDQNVTDVNGDKVKLGKSRHVVTPPVKLITIEDQEAE